MKLLPVENLKENNRLVVPLYNQYGRILVNSHVSLTKTMIERIKKYGVGRVFVESAYEVEATTETLSAEERGQFVLEIERTFQQISQNYNEQLPKNIQIDYNSLTQIVYRIMRIIEKREELVSVLSEMYVTDMYTMTHSLQCTVYSLQMGRAFGFSKDKLVQLGIATLLHDIGKLAIPDSILQKTDRLTDDEFRMIKRHPLFGYALLEPIAEVDRHVLRCVLEHHERLDGSGYPHGKSGEEISEFAQILAVVDVYDALTSHRVYRQRTFLPFEAMQLIEQDVGTKFSQRVFSTFKQAIILFPNGTVVTLNDGRRGVVFKQNSRQAERPIVRIIEENGKIVQ
ncbi:MAG: HD-GYP domain-containing protein, partial [Bacilli bacterium]